MKIHKCEICEKHTNAHGEVTNCKKMAWSKATHTNVVVSNTQLLILSDKINFVNCFGMLKVTPQ